jgi:DNA-binding IclR family transcriptional regulator
MLRRMAGDDTSLVELGAAAGLPRLAVWERVNGLVAVGLVGRRHEDDSAGLTPAGRVLVELVEGCVAAATPVGYDE